MPEQCVGISKDEQFHTCPRHSHIHAAYVGKEAYFALFVGAHKAYYYNVAFLSLKTVHGIYRHKVFERFEKGISAEHASQKLHLRFVGRDYAYVEVLFEHAVLSYFVYVVFKRVYGQFRFRRVILPYVSPMKFSWKSLPDVSIQVIGVSKSRMLRFFTSGALTISPP